MRFLITHDVSGIAEVEKPVVVEAKTWHLAREYGRKLHAGDGSVVASLTSQSVTCEVRYQGSDRMGWVLEVRDVTPKGWSPWRKA